MNARLAYQLGAILKLANTNRDAARAQWNVLVRRKGGGRYQNPNFVKARHAGVLGHYYKLPKPIDPATLLKLQRKKRELYKRFHTYVNALHSKYPLSKTFGEKVQLAYYPMVGKDHVHMQRRYGSIPVPLFMEPEPRGRARRGFNAFMGVFRRRR